MHKTYSVLISFGMIVLLSGIVSCSATRPTAEWRDEKYTGSAFNSILIIGISDEAIVRRMFEDTFVAELRKRNVEAVSGARLMPIDEKISRESVESAIEGKNINACIGYSSGGRGAKAGISCSGIPSRHSATLRRLL